MVSPDRQTLTTLSPTVAFPNPLTISIPCILPNCSTSVMPGVTSKRKVEEVRTETLPKQNPEQSAFQDTYAQNYIYRGK